MSRSSNLVVVVVAELKKKEIWKIWKNGARVADSWRRSAPRPPDWLMRGNDPPHLHLFRVVLFMQMRSLGGGMAGREKGSTTPPAHPPPGGTGLAPLPAKKMRFFLLFLVVGFAGEATSFFSVFFFGFFLLLRVVPGPPMAVTNEPVETRESPFLVVHAQNSETVGFSRILTKHLNSKPNKEMAVRRIPFSKKKQCTFLASCLETYYTYSLYVQWVLYRYTSVGHYIIDIFGISILWSFWTKQKQWQEDTHSKKILENTFFHFF